MEAKLKGMKVVDLKAILQNANVPFDSKLTKPALIKKILETPSAITVASAPEDSAGADDDLPDLPPSINWDDAPKATNPVPAAAPAAQKQTAVTVPQAKAPPPTPATEAVSSAQLQAAPSPPKNSEGSAFKAADIPTITADDEIERRRARAAKWGTEFVDPMTQPAAKTAAKPAKKAAPTAASPPEDEEKRKKREARFGASTSKAPAAAVDEEEMRKRKAREERFGPNKKPRLEGEASTK